MRVDAMPMRELRALDPLEETFWLLEHTVPRAAVLVAELEGPTTVRAWQDGLHEVERKYPLLTVRIRKIPGERPRFFHAPGGRVPFRIVPLTETVRIEAEMGREMEALFGDGSGPLARVTLFHGPARSVVLLASHHAAFDGKTNLMVLLDLVAAVAGESIGPSTPISPAVSTLFGVPAVGPYKERLPASRPAPRNGTARDLHLQVPRLQLSREETAALISSARAARTSVQGALVAALALAGRQYREAWRAAPIRYAAAIDVRPVLSMSDAPGLLISVHLGSVEPAVHAFWDLARAVSDDVAVSRKQETIRAFMLRMQQAVDVEHEPAGYPARQRDRGMHHHLMATNYGNAQPRSVFGPLKLTALSTGSASGIIDTQKISALTLDGRMMLTHVSADPFPSLLDDARVFLARSCAA